MTSIVVWPNYEVPSVPAIWVVGDSRISQPNGQTLIEDCAKMFSLPVVSRAPGPSGFFTEPYFAHTFGYCFAGSTLMGQNSYLAVAPLLMTLVSSDRYVPSMKDVAQFILRFLRKTFDDFKLRASAGARFEAALFGWCDVRKALQIWHFYPESTDNGQDVNIRLIPSMKRGTFLYLGDRKEYVSGLLQEAIAKDTTGLQRAPRHVVQALIKDESLASIGGEEQLAMANQYSFQVYPLLGPNEPGKPHAHMTYLGLELSDENRMVGNAWVGGPAMA